MNKDIKLSSRKKILDFQTVLISEVDGVDIVTHQDSKLFPLKHTFADGIYVRQMNMKKGSVVVGAIHKHLHVWFLLTGNISVATEETVEDYIAPCYVVATPGTKRVIHANEDSIFVNVHKNPTNTKDMSLVEDKLYSFTIDEFNKKEKLWQEQQ